MPRATKGTLIEWYVSIHNFSYIILLIRNLYFSDPSIRALILKIDKDHPGIVIDVSYILFSFIKNSALILKKELDDTHLLINQTQVQFVKTELNKLLTENVYNPLEDEQQ